MSLTLSSRDLDLLTTLTSRVRILAVSQLSILCNITTRNRRDFGRRLKQLADAGLIELHTVNAHLLNPPRPLVDWRPGRPDPDPVEVSLAARSRWRFAASPTLVCTASSKTANLHGSTACGLPKPEHRDHDLLLASAYLHFRSITACEHEWVGEHVLAKAGYRIKDPDAFLRDRNGNFVRVIESSGSYSAKQVESFHEHCFEHELPYELW